MNFPHASITGQSCCKKLFRMKTPRLITDRGRLGIFRTDNPRLVAEFYSFGEFLRLKIRLLTTERGRLGKLFSNRQNRPSNACFFARFRYNDSIEYEQRQDLYENFLETDAPLKVVLKLAIPSMLAQFVNVLYSIVDRIYIGNMPEAGKLALAGVGVCGPIVTLLASFGTWVGLGGAPAMSIKMGEKDLDGAKKILSNGAMLLAVMSVVLTAAVFVFKEPLLRLFGAGGNIAGYASDYLSWYAAGTVFAVVTTGLNAYIVGQGHGKAGMATVCIGAIANIVLDPLFIYTFRMGVAGAALATVLSQALSAVFTVLFLLGKKVDVRLSFGGYDKKIVGRILLLGLSPFLIIATDSVMILALNGVLRSYGGERGDELISAATIMLSFMQIITLPLGGISGGTQPALSYNYGANRPDRVKSCEGWILTLCILYTVALFLVARFAAAPVVAVFTSDAALKAESVRFIHIYTLMIIPLAFQYALVDGLTGLGIAPVAISLSLFRKLVLMLTLTLTLPRFLGAEGAFYAEPISDLAAGIISTIVFFCLIDKILKKRDREVRSKTGGEPPLQAPESPAARIKGTKLKKRLYVTKIERTLKNEATEKRK